VVSITQPDSASVPQVIGHLFGAEDALKLAD